MTTTRTKSLYYLLMPAFSFIIAFLLHLLLFSTAPMVTVIMEEMDLTYTEFGLVFSMAMISFILFRIPWGLASDKIGYLNALRISLMLSAACAILRAFSPGYVTLLLTQFLLGAGLASILPCLPLLVKEWAPEHIGLATGIYISGFATGNGIALALTPHMLNIMDWRDVLLVYGLFAIIMCLLWWILAKSSMRNTSEFGFNNFAKILRDRYVWALSLLMAAAMGSYDTLATWMPKVLEFREIGKTYAALLPLGFFVAGPTVGFVLDRSLNKRIVLLVLAITAVASIISINYTAFPILGIALILSGFSTIGVLTISLTLPAKQQRLSASVASLVGTTSSLSNIGSFLVPILFGFLMDVTGTYYASILAVAVFAGITFMVGSKLADLGG